MSSLHFDNVLYRLETILQEHFDDIGPQEVDHNESLRYRTVIFIFYNHLKFLFDNSAVRDPAEYPRWDRGFKYTIDLIHRAFGTIQADPYEAWPRP